MQISDGEASHLQCSSPFLRSRSPYALDIYTAIVLFHFYEGLTLEEIESEFNRRLHPAGGPRLITIKRWLSAFRQDASEHTSLFVKHLLEQGLVVPAKGGVMEHYQVQDFPCLYFLECITSLYGGLHPKSGTDFRFLWHANALVRCSSGSDLFQCRSP